MMGPTLHAAAMPRVPLFEGSLAGVCNPLSMLRARETGLPAVSQDDDLEQHLLASSHRGLCVQGKEGFVWLK